MKVTPMPDSFLDDRVRVLTGDITAHDVIAIVNAGNSTLLGGGGVDGAIHRIGGPQILEECKQIRETTIRTVCRRAKQLSPRRETSWRNT